MRQGERPSEVDTTLVVTGVRKRWGRSLVLDDVHLELGSGRLVWLGGANGAGKTTLLRIASGLLIPEAGQVSIRGWTPHGAPQEYLRRLGLATAGDRGLYARLSVRQNLDFAVSMALVPRSSRRRLVGQAVEGFGLFELADRRVDRMSMGQRQRVRLAMAFIAEPLVVLLDEPRTSLDADGVDLLGRALREVTARGGSALWCSPLSDEPPIAMDDTYVLADGKIRPC